MNSIYIWGTLVPTSIATLVAVALISYLSYRLHIADHFLWFKLRSVRETRDYQRIFDIILKVVTRDIAEKHLSEYQIKRIE